MVTRRKVLCAFGSNLFYQTDPDPGANQRIDQPHLVLSEVGDGEIEVLSTTASQTIVRRSK